MFETAALFPGEQNRTSRMATEDGVAIFLPGPLNRRSGTMRKNENAQSARVLRDDELDLVSGGAGGSFAIDIGTSEELMLSRRLEVQDSMVIISG